jgi:hypothetical protein
MGERDIERTELAVLTGDIVGSSRLDAGALDAAIGALGRAAETAAGWTDAEARFTRFRGDGWQCLGPSPEFALRTALFFRAHLRALDRQLDSRISVGIGSGRFSETGGLAAAGGSAFEVSGRGLDRMRRPARLAVAWGRSEPHSGYVGGVFALADEISRRWTTRQARVFSLRLAPGRVTQAAMAETLSVSQQMVAKHLRSGGDWALICALNALEGSTEQNATTL